MIFEKSIHRKRTEKYVATYHAKFEKKRIVSL
ncbi:uncharacterized protein METZ01_LOCUS360776 [marine metagenome]|uniref:Uncharacterized protein n=1 Tax=marine metagenome TaxID=408172 RepID=A0A382SEB4_9ZZZZ